MTNTVTGIVEQVYNKQHTFGSQLSIKIDGAWYGKLLKKGDSVDKYPLLVEGANVTLYTEQKGKYLNWTDVKVNSEVSGANDVVMSSNSSRIVGKDFRITHAAARNAAIHVAEILLKADALPLPANKKDKMNSILAFIHDMTAQYAVENWDATVEDMSPLPSGEVTLCE